MLNEFWIMLDLSFDLLLQATNFFADSLYRHIVCKFCRGERMMCTYGALCEFRTEANGSGMKLRWIFSVFGWGGTRISRIAG